MDTIFIALGVLACVALAIFVARKRKASVSDDIVVGGIYASQREDGTYGVVKVLAVDEDTIHVRMYKNKYDKLPEALDPAELSLGDVGDPEGFGIGHAPFAKDGWLKTETLVARATVLDEELDGYRYYLKARREGQ